MFVFFRMVYGRLSLTVLREILEGRMRRPGHPPSGRFLRTDIKRIHRATWDKADQMRSQARLQDMPGWSNKHNVLLAVVTVSLFHSLLDYGTDRDYAFELLADVGWKIYVRFLPIARTLARLRTPDPQEQMTLVLKSLLRFPFSAPGRLGYELQAEVTRSGAFATNWTWCPPFAFVREYVDDHGDRGELKAFFHSWCQYDWALADAIVEGTGYTGAYTRPHTLSVGDKVCDMSWGVEPSTGHQSVGAGDRRSKVDAPTVNE